MIRSMTGYGLGEKSANGFEAIVEVRSLNHRFLDVAMRLPRVLSSYEESVKEIVRRYVDRGRINVAISFKNEQQDATDLKIDARNARHYKELLEGLRDELGLAGAITIDHLLHFSEVWTSDAQEEISEEGWNCVRLATEEAMKNLNGMREREGVEIMKDLQHRIEILQSRLQELQQLASARRREEFQKLYKRLADMIDTRELDANRLELEIALLADRVDITEECIRFQSHNTLFLEATANETAAGRKLNFLLQEMNREANTIGAKANEATISHIVVDLKEEIEKLREQVQNLE